MWKVASEKRPIALARISSSRNICQEQLIEIHSFLGWKSVTQFYVKELCLFDVCIRSMQTADTAGGKCIGFLKYYISSCQRSP